MDPETPHGRLRLTPLSAARADAFAEASRAAAESVGRWMTASAAPTTPEAVAAFVARWEREVTTGTGAGYAVEDISAGRVVGFGFLNSIHPVHRFANLGYWVRPDAAGRGIATATVGLLAEEGFERFGLVRIEVVMEPGNAASRRVAEKAGAQFEGRLRNRLVSRGAVRDGLMFSLVPGDVGL